MFRIGLVGAGNIANVHARGIRDVAANMGEVVAACDPREGVLEEFGARWGLERTFQNATDLLSSGEVDVLALLTPPSVRDEVIFPTLDAGIPILVEKPFGTNGSNAVRYVKAAEAADVPLAVGQNFRWFPEYRWLDDIVGRDELGSISYIGAECFQDRRQQAGQWRADEFKLEMAIFSVHLIDRIQAITTASPTAVSAVTRLGDSTNIVGEQFSALTIEFDDGSIANMVSSWKARGLSRTSLRVDGTLGSACAERVGPMSGPAKGRVEVVDRPVENIDFEDPDDSPIAPITYGLSMLEFLESIQEGREAAHSGRNNLRTMGIMEAAYLSAARRGSPVTPEEVLYT